MSIFPARILLATDGSEEAELAARTAVDLANSTDSELHLVTVGRDFPDLAYRFEVYVRYEELLERMSQEAQEILDGQVKKVEEAGDRQAGSPQVRAARQGDRAPQRRDGGRPDHNGESGAWRDTPGAHGKRLGLGSPPCPLPRPDRARVELEGAAFDHLAGIVRAVPASDFDVLVSL